MQSCDRKLSEPENAQECKELIETRNCHPILVRLAWHDSGTYDQRIKDWPQCGGANGAIRFDPEMNMGANAGRHENHIHIGCTLSAAHWRDWRVSKRMMQT